MSSKVLFASSKYAKYDVDLTLPAKFKRMIDEMELKDRVSGKTTALKMHLGRNIGYTTIHPIFVKILVDKLKGYGAKVFICDQSVEDAKVRGYSEDYFGCPIVPVCGILDKYFYPMDVDFKGLKNVDIAGYIHDAEFMIDFSHVKGHGSCGYGGACKNIAMGCVTGRTRAQIHGLEGGITWNEDKCTRCEQCIKSCNHYANAFMKDGKYFVNYHHCTFCQHCVKVCPTEAIFMEENKYDDFQAGMALCTKTVLDSFKENSVYYINVLTNITALCDCWGLSTPSIVPDIGIMSSGDIVAVERACIDAVKYEDLLVSGLPYDVPLGEEGHLFERLHSRNPFIQLEELEKLGLGTQQYSIVEVE